MNLSKRIPGILVPFLAAVGFAPNRAEAEKRALARLTAFFGQSIQADGRILSSMNCIYFDIIGAWSMKLKPGIKSSGINTFLWFSGAAGKYFIIRKTRKTRLRMFLQSFFASKRKGALTCVKGLEVCSLKWRDI